MNDPSLLEAQARRLFIEIDQHGLGTPYLEILISIVLGTEGIEHYYTSGLDNADILLIRTAVPAQRIQAAEQVLHAHGIAIL